VDRASFYLQEACRAFAFDLWRETQPGIAAREAAALKIATACHSILSITGMASGEIDPSNLAAGLGAGGLFASAALRGEPSGKASIMNALRAVETLRTDALKMAEIEAKRRAMKPAKRGRPESASIKRLVAALSHLYFDVWERIPTVSRAKGGVHSEHAPNEPTGPLALLLEAVTNALQACGLRFYVTPDSLIKTWERLPADERGRFTA